MKGEEEFRGRLRSHTLVMGVVGLGYVGLPLALEMARAGYLVRGYDLQKERAEKAGRGESYIGDVDGGELAMAVRGGLFTASSDPAVLEDAEFIVLCVPTPLDRHQQPDLSCIRRSGGMVARMLRPGRVVVLESTTYPGTTEELLLPLLEEGSGLRCGEEFALAFSPERVDPGNRRYTTVNTPKVVGGVGEAATRLAADVYRQILRGRVVEVSSPRVAEMEKILENTYRHVNVGLANEMAILCQKMGINVWEVIDAASTKPYGFQPFYPGPGLGGHCIPLDPFYLTWKAREYGYHTRLIELSGEINGEMPAYVVARASQLLNRQGQSLKGARVLLLGAAYKADVADCRESPALRVMELLEEGGAQVAYYDPLVPVCRCRLGERKSVERLTGEFLETFQLILITTGHTGVDYPLVVQKGRLIFDTRNALAFLPPEKRGNVVLL